MAVLIVAGTLDYAYNLRKRLMQPTGHDTKLFAAALSALPVDGTVIRWLKGADMADARVTDFPADVLAALEKTAEYARTCPVGFDNQQLAASFETLADAITGFCVAVEHWTIASHGTTGSPGGTTTPTALSSNHQGLIRAYDGFVRTAHASGIDTDG